jgi:DNA polymerase III epsilon subunit-like protein
LSRAIVTFYNVWENRGMIVLDIEASGVNPEKHSIVSIGAIELKNPTNQFYDECKVWDGAHIDPQALEVNGFTEEEITDPSKKTEAEIVKAFIAWATDIEGDRTLAGQNVSFDRDFIRLGAERAGMDYPFAFRTIDTHTLAHMHMIKAGITPPYANHRSALNLDAVLNYCGIPDEPQPHNALTGAMSHAEVIARLLNDKKLLPEFDSFDIPWKTEG